MNEASGNRQSALRHWPSLAVMSKLLSAPAPPAETMDALLRWLSTLFCAEGAILWQVDESKRLLLRRQYVHLPVQQETEPLHISSAFAMETAAITLERGQGVAGRVWAQGETQLLVPDADFDATPLKQGATASNEDPLYCLGLPLCSRGSTYGVIELINCALTRLTNTDKVFLDTVGATIGTFVSAQDAGEQARWCKQQSEHSAHQARLLEDDLRSTKARLSQAHQDLVQNALADARLFAQISRELRNPLGGIMSVVELLQRTNQDRQQQEYASLIKESAQSILNVLQTLVERGRDTNEQVAVDYSGPQAVTKPIALKDARLLVLTGLVGSAEFIEAYATASGIKCQCQSRGYTGLTAMKQAAAAGRPFDLVFVERVLPDMDAFEFARQLKSERTLADTPLILVSTFGATDAQDTALDAGFRAHIARPAKQALVINLVQAILEGTNLQEAAEAPEAMPTPAIVSDKPIILVAEDSTVNQKVALLQLREMGFYAEVVANGKQAVAAAKQSIFNAILMDCQMPELDGFQATTQIRQWEQENGLHTPIIAMTARALAADRDRCLAVGMDDYLSKPVTYDKLYSVLSRWLPVANTPEPPEDLMDKPADHQFNFAPEPQSVPVDMSMLKDMLGQEEATEILKLFMESSQELMEVMDTAVNQHDAAQLQDATHTLKGACSSVGANDMWRECLELEQAVRDSDWAQIPTKYSVLTALYRQARTFLQNKL